MTTPTVTTTREPAGNGSFFAASLPAQPESAAVARGHVRAMLAVWHLDRAELAHEVELLVSELVTNSLRHGRGEVGLRFCLDASPNGKGRFLRMEVSDGATEGPRRRQPDHDETSGRGLVVVEALADAWGCQTTSEGKTVWATVRVR